MDILSTPATVVWANTTGGFRHPLTDALDSAGMKSARVTIEMPMASGPSHATLWVQGFYEWSSDGKTWSDPTAIGGAIQLANNMNVGSFETISLTNSKRYIRFGAKAWNNAGTDLNLCFVALRIEPRST